jgi:hypothetical protein
MSSALSSVPYARRKRAAQSAALLAVIMVAVFAVSWARPAPGFVRLVTSVALLGAIVLGLMSWGLLRSMRLDQAEARLDAAVAREVAHAGAGLDCGHEHDADELHVTDTDPACEAGDACDHSCAACVLGRNTR